MICKLNKEISVAVAMVLFFGGMTFMAVDLHPLVRLFPLAVCIPMLVLVCIQLFSTLSPQVKSLLDKVSDTSSSRDTSKKTAAVPIGFGRELKIFAWLVFLFILLWVLGLLPSTVLFLIVFLKIKARQNWKIKSCITLGALTFMYLLFGIILDMELLSEWLS